MIGDEKIVDFSMCKTCKHEEEPENVDPCETCLDTPGRVDSRRPLNYEEDPAKVSKAREKN